MKVNLIDYTGAESSDRWHAARMLVYVKNTRLTQGEETRHMVNRMTPAELLLELDAIAVTIRSSWEFVDYTFEIQDVTRAFTHQLVRTRTASYAQQAQRVVDMKLFGSRLPKTVEDAGKTEMWSTTMMMLGSVYAELQNAGVPNQDCRGVLPTNVLTNIITKMNLRTLADTCGKRDNLRAQDEYGEVVRAMKASVYHVHPWVRQFLEPDRLATPELDDILRQALGNSAPVDKPKVNAALKELDALKATWG